MKFHPLDRVRGHQLLPASVAKTLPAIYANENTPDLAVRSEVEDLVRVEDDEVTDADEDEDEDDEDDDEDEYDDEYDGDTNTLPEYEVGEKLVLRLISYGYGGYVVRLGEGRQHWWFARDLQVACSILRNEIEIELPEFEDFMQDMGGPTEICVEHIERWRKW